MSEYVCHPDRKLFEVGEYPDKGFSMTEDEMKRCAGEEPVELDLEHTPTLLDGQLGYCANRRVVSENGKAVLKGDVYIPTWLEPLLPQGKSRLSCTFDRETKQIRKLALVQNPRVPDAVLMGAYAQFAARHDTPSGQSAMQMIHDHAARMGARCSTDNTARMHNDIDFHSAHESRGLQEIHDKAVEHGAMCHAMGRERPSTVGSTYVGYSRSESGSGANASGDGASSARRQARMNLWEHFKRALGAVEVPDDVPDGNTSPPPPTASMSQAPPADTRVAELEKKLALMEAEKTRSEAVAFSENLIRSGRAVPAERDGLVTTYLEFAEMDRDKPKEVTFSVNGEQKKGGRLEQWAAGLLSRPQHHLDEPVLRTIEGDHALFTAQEGDSEDGSLSPAERERLLSMTPLGQALLAKEKGQRDSAKTIAEAIATAMGNGNGRAA